MELEAKIEAFLKEMLFESWMDEEDYLEVKNLSLKALR